MFKRILVIAAVIINEPNMGSASSLKPCNRAVYGKGQPLLNRNESWLQGHPGARIVSKTAKALSVCLFGVAGVSHSKAGTALRDNTTNTEAVFVVAESIKKYIVFPAKRDGAIVRVYAHSWASPGSAIARAVDSAYRDLMVTSVHEQIIFRHHVVSMVASMRAVLSLVPFADAKHPAILMRHDCFWHHPLEVVHLDLAGGAIVTASWCEARLRRVDNSCGSNEFTRYRGVHDYFMIAESAAVAKFVDIMMSRIQLNGMKSCNERAHFALEEHAEACELKASSLWQSHPLAVSYVDFTLYRWRRSRFIRSNNYSSSAGRPACFEAAETMPPYNHQVCYLRERLKEIKSLI